ncbi:MAG: hypothetical protein IPM50_10485 [Acidobacteriota bacterium]|nr:MAG: hypothetical protein IPM50_10485 [Acidobacteriota bacterium]
MENPIPSTKIGEVLSVLNEMRQAGIVDKYAIGGAFAAILHNEPISTIDLDIFFLFKEKQSSLVLSLDSIYEFARARGFSFDHEFVNIHGWLVQFVEASQSRLWSEAIENAIVLSIDSLDVFVIDKEYLIAMWLFAGRAKDYQKIAAFVDSDILDTEKLTDILERHQLLVKWKNEKWRFMNE